MWFSPIGTESPLTTAFSWRLWQPTIAEEFLAAVDEGKKYVSISPLIDQTVEMQSRGWSQTVQTTLQALARFGPQVYDEQLEMARERHRKLIEAGDTRRYLSEDEWKDSSLFRPGLDFKYFSVEGRGMLEERAELLAEEYDDRMGREFLFSQSPGGFVRGTVRFAGMMAPQLLDPVNLIPIAGPLARLGVATRIGFLSSRLIAGAAEGVIGNAVADVAIRGRMSALGTPLTWQEILTDLMMGAGLGGVLGYTFGKFELKKQVAVQQRVAVTQLLMGEEVDMRQFGAGWIEFKNQLDAGRLDPEMEARALEYQSLLLREEQARIDVVASMAEEDTLTTRGGKSESLDAERLGREVGEGPGYGGAVQERGPGGPAAPADRVVQAPQERIEYRGVSNKSAAAMEEPTFLEDLMARAEREADPDARAVLLDEIDEQGRFEMDRAGGAHDPAPGNFVDFARGRVERGKRGKTSIFAFGRKGERDLNDQAVIIKQQGPQYFAREGQGDGLDKIVQEYNSEFPDRHLSVDEAVEILKTGQGEKRRLTEFGEVAPGLEEKLIAYKKAAQHRSRLTDLVKRELEKNNDRGRAAFSDEQFVYYDGAKGYYYKKKITTNKKGAPVLDSGTTGIKRKSFVQAFRRARNQRPDFLALNKKMMLDNGVSTKAMRQIDNWLQDEWGWRLNTPDGQADTAARAAELGLSPDLSREEIAGAVIADKHPEKLNDLVPMSEAERDAEIFNLEADKVTARLKDEEGITLEDLGLDADGMSAEILGADAVVRQGDTIVQEFERPDGVARVDEAAEWNKVNQDVEEAKRSAEAQLKAAQCVGLKE